MSRLHAETHLVSRVGWLRAAVLGANDGIVSTASLIVGVAAAAATRSDVLLAGIAGLVAGAMSMAAGSRRADCVMMGDQNERCPHRSMFHLVHPWSQPTS